MAAKFLKTNQIARMGNRHSIKLATCGMVTALTLIACAPAQKANPAPAAAPAAQQGNASGGLQTINNPGGGQVVYGPVPTESTIAGAMGVVLRDVHGHFGDKPLIGKLFQSRGGDSVATFFTLKAVKQDGKPMTGLVIISMPKGEKPAAAVLYDTSDRFPKTESALMAKLNDAWSKASVQPASATGNAAGNAAAPAGHGGAVPALQPAAVSDNSATVSLPSGWRIVGGGGGSAQIAGPNGEMINMAVMVQNIYDPQNPRSAGMIRYMSMRNPPIQCPRSSDLGAAYQCVLQQSRAINHLSPATFTISKETPIQGGQVILNGEMDQHDGKGPLTAKIQVGASQEGPQGGWAMTIFGEFVPKPLAAQEWPTIDAITGTFRQNGQVINAETQTVINQIHQRAAANNALVKARSDANDAHNAAVEQQWDNNAKYSKSFEDYTLDQSVVRATDAPNVHGTFDNQTANALVKSNPDKFQYVPTQDLLKGVDY